MLIHGTEEYRGYRAIYPPRSEVRVIGACYSCNGDVKSENGFVDMSKQPFKGYLCATCMVHAIPGHICADLLMYAQEKYRKSKE